MNGPPMRDLTAAERALGSAIVSTLAGAEILPLRDGLLVMVLAASQEPLAAEVVAARRQALRADWPEIGRVKVVITSK